MTGTRAAERISAGDSSIRAESEEPAGNCRGRPSDRVVWLGLEIEQLKIRTACPRSSSFAKNQEMLKPKSQSNDNDRKLSVSAHTSFFNFLLENTGGRREGTGVVVVVLLLQLIVFSNP